MLLFKYKHSVLSLFFKARVDRVKIDGLSRTKDDIVRDAVQELFGATDFEEVIIKAHRVSCKTINLLAFSTDLVF